MSTSKSQYEVIMIGNGLNELNAGAIFARKGKKVLIIGGKPDCRSAVFPERSKYPPDFLIHTIQKNGGKIISNSVIEDIKIKNQNHVEVKCSDGNEYCSNIIIQN